MAEAAKDPTEAETADTEDRPSASDSSEDVATTPETSETETPPADVWADRIDRLEAEIKAEKSTPARLWVHRAIDLATEAAAAGQSEAVDRLSLIARREAPRVRSGAFSKKVLSRLITPPLKAIKEGREVSAAATMPAFGANQASEQAVDRALDWLARHQRKDGSWSFDHKTDQCDSPCGNPGSLDQAFNAATAVALLPFLAAGNGARAGDFRKKVADGLNFLKQHMTPIPPAGLTLHEFDGGNMPSHALGTMVLCEACVIDSNRELRQAATAAVWFILNTQNLRDGGWAVRPWTSPSQLRPQKPSRTPKPLISQNSLPPSDIYSTAWNIAALKTAQWAELDVEGIPQALKRAGDYLESPRVRSQLDFRNRRRRDANATNVAAAMLAQMFAGWPKDNKQLVDYAQTLAGSGPAGPGHVALDYYNAQVMRNLGGPPWATWNAKVRDALVARQVRDGHAAGSWDPAGNGSSVGEGGRLLCTALAALTLEVCYRYPPLYDE